MFNPGGGEEAKLGTRNGGGLNYKAVFTGIVDAIPLAFNPTKQQIIQIKGIPMERQQSINEPNYVGVFERDGIKQTKLDVLMKINPNELLCDKDENGVVIKKEYLDDFYFNLNFTISAEDEVSSDKDKDGNPKTPKYRFINESLQSIWAESIDAIKANPKLDWFKTETARVAKKGEVMLYNLLSAMYKLVGTKEKPITGFKLGEDPTATFLDIVNGDVSMLNDLLDKNSKAYSYFSHDDGTVRKVAVMLGAKESDKVDDEGNPRFNQVVYTNAYVVSPFAKEGRSLPKDAIASIKGDGFKASIQGSLKFQVYDPAKAIKATMDAMANVEATSIDMPAFTEDDYATAFSDTDFS